LRFFCVSMNDTPKPQIVMDSGSIERALTRISHEIAETNKDRLDQLILMGIPARGDILADRLKVLLKAHTGQEMPKGIVDITFHRDDLSGKAPIPKKSDIPSSLDGKIVILVDDVLFTGRSARAAMDALNDWGRPKAIRYAVLVDRGHRELPIRADYVGKNIPTQQGSNVKVELLPMDGVEQVTVEEAG